MADMTLVAKNTGYVGSAGGRIDSLVASKEKTGEFSVSVGYRVDGMVGTLLRHTEMGGGGTAYVRREDLERVKSKAPGLDTQGGGRNQPGTVCLWLAAD